MRLAIALLTLVLLGQSATPAHAAGGLAMRWDRCYGDGGENNRNFACDTNAGVERLVMSYVPDIAMPNWVAAEFVVDALAGASTTPSWWLLASGQCRAGSLSANPTTEPASAGCFDPYQGRGAGAGAVSSSDYGPNRMRLLAVFAVAAENALAIAPGTEYFGGNFVINHARTTGTGACAGCAEPFCLILTQAKLSDADNNFQLLTEPLAPYSAVVGWQGASPTLYYSPPSGPPRNYPGEWQVATCLSATPAKRPTWGAIKALYR